VRGCDEKSDRASVMSMGAGEEGGRREGLEELGIIYLWRNEKRVVNFVIVEVLLWIVDRSRYCCDNRG